VTGRGTGRSLAVAFAALGGTAAVIPSVIPALALELGVTTTALLPAVPALFGGLLAGVLSISFLARYFSLTALLRIGSAAQAIGLALAGFAPTPVWFVVGSGIAGAGFGLVEAGGSAVVRVLGALGMPRALTRLTLWIAIVAAVTPLLVLAVATLGWARPVPLLLAGLHLALVFALRGIPSAAPPAAAAIAPARPRAATVRVSLLTAALFCYVGTETVISGWSASTFERELGTTAAVAALGTSAFWLLISLGRLAGTVALDRRGPGAGNIALLCTALIAGSLGLAALTASRLPVVSLALIGVAVFASGPCYALLLGLAVGQAAEDRAVQASSWFIALGATGGVAISFLAVNSTALGPQAPTVIAGIAAAAMFVFFLAWRASAGRSRMARGNAVEERAA